MTRPRPWCLHSKLRLAELWCAGEKIPDIARILDRSPAAVISMAANLRADGADVPLRNPAGAIRKQRAA